MMQGNVKFYSKKVKDKSRMLPHELPDSVDEFNIGVTSYMKLDYAAATHHLNQSLSCEYLSITSYISWLSVILAVLSAA